MVNDLVYTDVALRSCTYLEAVDNVVTVAWNTQVDKDRRWSRVDWIIIWESREALLNWSIQYI